MESAKNLSHNDIETYLKRLRPGAVLLARSELMDPNFEAAVVLICVYNNDGVYGLVLNRASHMPVSEVFDGYSDYHKIREIRIGGPVQQDELQILQITTHPMEEAYEVVQGVYVGGKWQSIDQIITADKTQTLLFLGYSGWGREQLEEEIRAGAWDVYSVNTYELLLGSLSKMTGSISSIKSYLESIISN